MKVILLSFLTLISILSFAQADLVCSNITSTQTSLSLGQRISFNFRIKNIGNSAAGISHSGVYLIDSATSKITYLADVSTESLSANSETVNYSFILPLLYRLPAGSSKILIKADNRKEINESDSTNNISYSQNSIIILNNYKRVQNLPYPVILIHGLTGNDTTWYPFLRDELNFNGYSYGGTMDFCLNQDGNLSTSNYSKDIKDWTDTSKLSSGDFYTINFDIDNLGIKYNNSALIQSNQSAITKQGIAMKKAIEHVLYVTGRDKVILVGHSMGGLAAREYLQNKSNWQNDKQHHVAKLFTTGTPHGGSNSTSGNLTSIFKGVDERSEAVRDLRRTYDVSGDSGVYLYGGVEDLTVMNNSIIEDYFNSDVNCNSKTLDNIVGLNHKTIPTDLSYTCVIGNDTYPIPLCANCDGVVNFYSANLNNFYPQIKADTFYCAGSGSPLLLGGKPWHVELPKQFYFNSLGLDEPDNKSLAYPIALGKHYFGNFTSKNAASISTVDSDYYKFTIPSLGSLTTYLFNIPTSQASIKIIDSATGTRVLLSNSNGKGYLGKLISNLAKGTYYLNIYSQADFNSWNTPYCFELVFTPNSLPITDIALDVKILSNTFIQTNWQTSTELNTSHFFIQHSRDGSSFTDIGTVKAIGSGANGYSFTDEKPTNGINYYRLKSVDKDGSFSYSKVVSVQLTIDNYQLSIYPNPAKNKVTVRGSHIAAVQVVDNLGRVLKIVSFKDASNPVLTLTGMPAGIYHLRVQTTDGKVNGVGFVVN